MIATPRRIPSWNDKHQYATRAFGSGDGNMPPREAGEPITDQSMARQLGLAASENKKHLRQRTATIRREQTAKNATNLFRSSNNPNELGFKHLVDIEGVTGSIPVAPTTQSYPNRKSQRRLRIGRFCGDFRWYRSALSVSGEHLRSLSPILASRLCIQKFRSPRLAHHKPAQLIHRWPHAPRSLAVAQ
jgi:hypothetical protein